MHLFSYQYSIVKVQSWETKKIGKCFQFPRPLVRNIGLLNTVDGHPTETQPDMNQKSHGSCSAIYRSRARPWVIPDAQSARHLGQKDTC